MRPHARWLLDGVFAQGFDNACGAGAAERIHHARDDDRNDHDNGDADLYPGQVEFVGRVREHHGLVEPPGNKQGEGGADQEATHRVACAFVGDHATEGSVAHANRFEHRKLALAKDEGVCERIEDVCHRDEPRDDGEAVDEGVDRGSHEG